MRGLTTFNASSNLYFLPQTLLRRFHYWRATEPVNKSKAEYISLPFG
jgi:hypothetical protein